jgi:hypothetical protein
MRRAEQLPANRAKVEFVTVNLEVTSSAAIQVPFKGSFEASGAASVLPDDRCPDLTVEIQGPGTATHLGRLTTD